MSATPTGSAGAVASHLPLTPTHPAMLPLRRAVDPATLPPLEVDPPPDRAPSATVAGNSLLAFTSNVSSAHKTALLYALGWVQLQAVQNHDQDPKTNPVGYYEKITEILTEIGFVTAAVQFAELTTKTHTATVDQVILEIMGELVTAPELVLVEAAIAALKSSADDTGAPWTIYSSSAESSDTGSFSIGLANETTAPDGTTSVALTLSAFSFEATASDTSFLWMNYSSTSVKIKDGSTNLVLNDNLWDDPDVGAMITKAMKEMSKGYIANLPPLKPKS